MDCGDFNEFISYVSPFGIILNQEEKAALQSSLVILRNEQKALRVKFWGKIIGVRDNYYIAQSIGKDELVDKKSFYSLDCIRWSYLTPATRDVRTRARLIKGRFVGDPAADIEYAEPVAIGSDDPPVPKTMKEEERLAATVADIDEEVAIAPRRAFVMTPQGHVVENRSFSGLSLSESVKLYNYLHLRDPQAGEKSGKPPATREMASYERSLDFLEPVESDLPRGSWALQVERGSGLVIVASLLWPGYVFFHVPHSRKFGAVYFGIGEKNKDLPFMLP